MLVQKLDLRTGKRGRALVSPKPLDFSYPMFPGDGLHFMSPLGLLGPQVLMFPTYPGTDICISFHLALA